MAALSAAAAAACGAFSSTPDEQPGVVAPDGGDNAEASIAPDGGTPEAASVSDAAAPTGPFCEAVDAQFCWSFDAVPELLGPVLSERKTDGGAFVVDSGSSLPNAMGVALGEPGYSGVKLSVAKDVSHMACEADFWFDAVDSAASVSVSILQLDWVGSNFNLPFLKVKKSSPTTLRAALGFGGLEADLGNVPIGQWVHASIDSAIESGQWRLRARVFTNAEGKLAAGPRAVLLRFDKIFFGLATLDSPLKWNVRVDNLVCRWQ